MKINSDIFNAEGKRIYPNELKVGESGYRLAKRGWVMTTTGKAMVDNPGGIPEIKLDMTLVFMPFFRGKCET